jgi:hypothetical protein
MEDALVTARRMWTLYEPVHVVTYFAPEARKAFEAAGLRGFWRGYFAGRAAPLAIATFCNFAPSFVRRALPAVWELITPSEALRVREAGAVVALRALIDGSAGQPGPSDRDDVAARSAPGLLRGAADLLLAVTEDLDVAGRPLGGPNAAQPVPADPFARLWWAATVLREHRGDGHVAALVAAGIDGCEALVLRTAVDVAGAAEAGAGAAGAGAAEAGAGPAGAGAGDGSAGEGGMGGGLARARERLQSVRGWSDEAWNQAADRLRDRGWLDSAGVATAAGLAIHQAVEEATDRAAARPWLRLGRARTSELAESLIPIADACAAVVPYPNPVGLPRPAAP